MKLNMKMIFIVNESAGRGKSKKTAGIDRRAGIKTFWT